MKSIICIVGTEDGNQNQCGAIVPISLVTEVKQNLQDSTECANFLSLNNSLTDTTLLTSSHGFFVSVITNRRKIRTHTFSTAK